MPVLPQRLQAQYESAEAAGSYALIPNGLYEARLREVKVNEGKNDPYWVWEFEIIAGEFESRRLWNNTSLSEKSLPFLKKTLLAFGSDDPTANTDELLGQWCVLSVGRRTIASGEREGEVVNSIVEVLPYDDDGAEDAREADESPAP